MASPAPIDEAVVAQLEGIKEGLFRQLATMFLEDLPVDLGALQDAVAARDRPATRQAAHKLAGTSATVGASGAAGLAREVEGAAERDEQTATQRGLAALEKALADVRRALEQRLA